MTLDAAITTVCALTALVVLIMIGAPFFDRWLDRRTKKKLKDELGDDE
jgi:hypothetical protein